MRRPRGCAVPTPLLVDIHKAWVLLPSNTVSSTLLKDRGRAATAAADVPGSKQAVNKALGGAGRDSLQRPPGYALSSQLCGSRRGPLSEPFLKDTGSSPPPLPHLI